MFYPPKWDAKHIQWASTVLFTYLLMLRLETYFEKKGHPGILIFRFWNREKVLSPEGRFKAYPVGVQLFLLMFYPPKWDAKHIQ